MNFPCRGAWYLVPHDHLVELIGQTTNWLNTSSWQDNGGYSSTNPAPALLEQLRPYAIEELPKPAPQSTKQTGKAPAPPARARTVTGTRPEPLLAELGNSRHPNLTATQRALTAAGYSCSPPPAEWRGNYLTARQRDAATNIVVRYPGRPSIQEDHIGLNLYVAFPDQDGIWYLVEHDELVRLVEANTPWLETDSWRLNGWYSSVSPSRQLRAALRKFALNAT